MIAFILWLGCVVFVLVPPVLIACTFIEGLKEGVKYTLAGIVSILWMLVSLLFIKSELIKFIS